MLWCRGVVGLGIFSVGCSQKAPWPLFLTPVFHRNRGLQTLIFLAIHVVTAVVDPFTALGWEAAIVPFSSPYRRFWLGLRVVRIYLLPAIVATTLLRPLFGPPVWRMVPWLPYPTWPLAPTHTLGTGTAPPFPSTP